LSLALMHPSFVGNILIESTVNAMVSAQLPC
jgi:hypothetical protein